MLRSFEKNACPTLVTRFSTSRFFHDSNPSGPLINRPKYFRIQLRFCQDIQIFKKLRGVHPTAESDSAVCCIRRSQALRCASHRRVKLGCVHHTVESSDEKFSKNSEVCIPLWSQTPRFDCASYHGVKICVLHHTSESITYQVSVLIRSFTIAISLC